MEAASHDWSNLHPDAGKDSRRSTLTGGYPVTGFDIGIITLRTRHPLMHGNVQNARSYAGPVLFEVLDDADAAKLMRGDADLIPAIVAAARRLEASGVKAIVGACGSFAYYQDQVAAAVTIPTFMSIMVQCQFLLASLPPDKKLCAIFASKSAFNDQLIEACHIQDPSRLIAKELRGQPEFDRILRGEIDFNPDRLEREVLEIAKSALEYDPGIAAFLLQCSDLPPFSAAINRATGRPVFDMVMLVNWLQSSFHAPAWPF